MTWSDLYLLCFLVGFGLSVLSVLLGTVHIHLPHLHFHAGAHMPDVHGGPHGVNLSWFNFGTLAAFLAWFGGTGYLLDRYYSVWFVTALVISTASGLLGAAVIFWFLAKVLIGHEHSLDPADYEMVGVLGRVNSPIRAGGIGEMIFSQEGVRRVAGARSEDGAAIPKGAEVVVTRYEKGVAYVRRWEDLTGHTAGEFTQQQS